MTRKKWLISLFVVFNTFMVIRGNRGAMPIARSFIGKHVFSILDKKPPLLRNPIGWYLSWYSYFAGTDLIAVMFSTLSRREWNIQINAKYANGRDVLLPLPLQSPRSFLQRSFFDNKEIKFHNNLYADASGQKKYAYYLCREFPGDQGAPIQDIVFHVWWRPFLTREEARRRGLHAEGPFNDYVMGKYPCPVSGGPR